jgi:hypothetical protein
MVLELCDRDRAHRRADPGACAIGRSRAVRSAGGRSLRSRQAGGCERRCRGGAIGRRNGDQVLQYRRKIVAPRDVPARPWLRRQSADDGSGRSLAQGRRQGLDLGDGRTGRALRHRHRRRTGRGAGAKTVRARGRGRQSARRQQSRWRTLRVRGNCSVVPPKPTPRRNINSA